MKKIFKIENLSSGYNGNTIIKNISFTLNEGEVLAVIGQNGCGKSTLLKTISRFIKDNTGNIGYRNINLQSKKTYDLNELGISWFVQGGMVLPSLRVDEHFTLVLRDKTKAEANLIIEECLTYFPKLKNVLKKRGGNLSGGQRQMLSFALLLSQQTECWLLDEPTAGLSPEAVNESLEFLIKMKNEENKTMLLVEHNYNMAFQLADRVGIIKEGKWINSFSKKVFLEKDFLDIHLYN